MSRATLRNNDGNPHVYLEAATGSTAFGVEASTDTVNLITSDSVQNLDPASGSPSISVESTTPGDITFYPKGIGQSTFNNGSVEILADSGSAGNLLMQDTNTGGVAGVIEYGGSRFIHNYGTNNTFVGDISGNFSLTPANADNNTAVGYNSLNALTDGSLNVAVGSGSSDLLTTGFQNVAVGHASLGTLVTGTDNTAIGFSALANINSSGSTNTAIGTSAGVSLTGTDSNNVIIHNSGTAGDNNRIRIGRQSGGGAQTTCFIAGISGASITATGVVGINGSGQLGSSTGSNGQILIGGGAGPVWGNITSTDGSITVTNGANTINVATTAQPGITWSEVTGTTQAAAANAGYIANNAGTVTITLLAAASAGIGTKLRVTGINNATGWVIAQNASQQIFFGTSSTTAGVTGSLASTATRDSVELVCVSANGLFWNVLSSVGNITVA